MRHFPIFWPTVDTGFFSYLLRKLKNVSKIDFFSREDEEANSEIQFKRIIKLQYIYFFPFVRSQNVFFIFNGHFLPFSFFGEWYQTGLAPKSSLGTLWAAAAVLEPLFICKWHRKKVGSRVRLEIQIKVHFQPEIPWVTLSQYKNIFKL